MRRGDRSLIQQSAKHPDHIGKYVVEDYLGGGMSNVYRAIVRNQSQLTYHAVGAWLENRVANGSPVTERMLAKHTS